MNFAGGPADDVQQPPTPPLHVVVACMKAGKH